MKFPTLSSVFDLGDGNGAHSHSKVMSFAITVGAVVYAFTHTLRLEDVAYWSLVFASTQGIAGLRLWLAGRKNGVPPVV